MQQNKRTLGYISVTTTSFKKIPRYKNKYYTHLKKIPVLTYIYLDYGVEIECNYIGKL
jgi:hypothetical protein